MNIGEIFKDSLKYPFTNSKQFIILAVLFLLGNLGNLFVNFNVAASNLIFVFEIVAIITSILAGGYLLKIIKNGTLADNQISEFNLSQDFVSGIKIIVLGIVFFIIPFVIAVLVAQVTGFFTAFVDVLEFSLNNPSVALPTALSNSLGQSTAITGIVSSIVFFIFSIFCSVAVCILASTQSLKEALGFKRIVNDISGIGWGKYIAWIIVNCIIILILSIIFSFIMTGINYIGFAVWYFLFQTYMSLYSARSLGLIYSNS